MYDIIQYMTPYTAYGIQVSWYCLSTCWVGMGHVLYMTLYRYWYQYPGTVSDTVFSTGYMYRYPIPHAVCCAPPHHRYADSMRYCMEYRYSGVWHPVHMLTASWSQYRVWYLIADGIGTDTVTTCCMAWCVVSDTWHHYCYSICRGIYRIISIQPAPPLVVILAVYGVSYEVWYHVPWHEYCRWHSGYRHGLRGKAYRILSMCSTWWLYSIRVYPVHSIKGISCGVHDTWYSITTIHSTSCIPWGGVQPWVLDMT